LKITEKYDKIYLGGDFLFIIKLANINIGINSRFSSLKSFCREYISGADYFDFNVSVTDDEIAAEREITKGQYSDAYLESVCIYRAICRRLPEYGAFLLHAAVVRLDGEAYAFSAPSGTGKSTHVSLWKDHFGERAEIINGDKPVLRFVDGKLRVYGTPWCGKEGYNKNSDAPLSAICFLEQGKTNIINKLDAAEAVLRVFKQILLPRSEKDADLLFPLLDKMLTTVPCFKLSCNISDEAVTVAYNAITKGSSEL